jgi:hypothetical protein
MLVIAFCADDPYFYKVAAIYEFRIDCSILLLYDNEDKST